MTGLQLNVGLISGINFVELVDQLVRIDSIPMENLQARTDRLAAEANALTDLMALFLTSSYMIRRLNNVTPFRMTEATSNNPDLISVSRTGNPPIGSYTFTPLQMASAQQSVAQGVASASEPLGKTGTITIGKGWSVENDIELKDLNGGMGVEKGTIRLIDGNGVRANIDLRQAMTVRDVINAINENHDIDIVAELKNDHIILRDVSGGTSDMIVQEVSGGSTAASLGLIGNGVAVDADGVLRGNTIWRLGERMSLSLLNDGQGLVFDDIAIDLAVLCRDGSRVNVDFFRMTTEAERQAGAPNNIREITVGDLLNTINNSLDTGGAAGKISARISDDGKGIVIEDNTVGTGYTAIMQGVTNNPILHMLGLADSNNRGMTTQTTMFSDLLARVQVVNPVEVAFTNKAGERHVIEITREDLLDFEAMGAQRAYGTNALALAVIAGRFNSKLSEAGADITLSVNSTADGFSLVDRSDGPGTTTIEDLNFDLASRLGLTGMNTTEGVTALVGAIPGTMRFWDNAGNFADIEISREELDDIKTAEDLEKLFREKLTGTDVEGSIIIGLNDDENAVTFTIESNGTTSFARIFDISGNIATRLGLNTSQATPVQDALADLNITPGDISFTNMLGDTLDISIDQAELDGITSMQGLADLFNGKLRVPSTDPDADPGTTVAFSVQARVNGAENGLIFTDSSFTSAPLYEYDPDDPDIPPPVFGSVQIFDLSGDFAEKFKLDTATEMTVFTAFTTNPDPGPGLTGTGPIATPGGIRFTDRAGNVVEFEITDADLDALTDVDSIAQLFNDKIDGEVSIRVDVSGGRLTFTDYTNPAHFAGDGPDYPWNVQTFSRTDDDGVLLFGESNLPDLLGISGGTNSNQLAVTVAETRMSTTGLEITREFETRAIEIQTVSHGGKVQSNVIQTRNLLGGLDTVLMSSLNAGSGLAGEYGVNPSVPGAVEIQDRSGNKAALNFSYEDIKSMQTLGQAVSLYNQKIADHNATVAAEERVGITVRINDMKTGLEIVDTTGSSSHNLIFRDVVEDLVLPEIPPLDGISGGDGLAKLTFQDTNLMNGFSFAFTTTEDPVFANNKFTFYISPEIAAETDDNVRDTLLRESINTQIVDLWDRLPDAHQSHTPPMVTFPAGTSALALIDAASGAETRIAEGVPGAQMGVTHFPGQTFAAAINPRIASNFGLNIDEANSRVSGTSLNRQVVSFTTPLSELNGGAGVNMTNGAFSIVDSSTMIPNPNSAERNARPMVPDVRTIIIDPERHRTVGDIINAINRQNLAIRASLNQTGDGIMIEELGGGTGTFSIYDSTTNSQFAASLGIAGSVSPSQRDELGRGIITTSETHRIEIVATDSLNDVRDKINALDSNYAASIVNDGSSAPFRLSVSSKTTGEASAFNIDLSALGLSTVTMTEAKDAKMIYGDSNTANSLILTSSTNSFQGIVEGIDMTINGTSNTPVTITSASSSLDVKVSLEQFVENYNRYRENLNLMMTYSVDSDGNIQVMEDGGILWNSAEAKAFDRDLTRILMQTITGVPGIRTLADLGITIRGNLDDIESGASGLQTGMLAFDEDKFQAAWDRDPEAVQKFFFQEQEIRDNNGNTITIKTGWAQKFTDVSDTLVGSADGSIMGKTTARIDSLDRSISQNDQRIAFMNERLEWKRQMYLKQFYAMEQAMARMTSDMSAVGNLSSAWAANSSNG
ncbi:MAG: flagellar filament capping protein FliD [Planctomycetaceae bacterium]|nr:flagellar filament capping protein FliD [Planctomycetaceae bacterium]